MKRIIHKILPFHKVDIHLHYSGIPSVVYKYSLLVATLVTWLARMGFPEALGVEEEEVGAINKAELGNARDPSAASEAVTGGSLAGHRRDESKAVC